MNYRPVLPKQMPGFAFDEIKARLEMFSRMSPPDREQFLADTCADGDENLRQSVAQLYDERFTSRPEVPSRAGKHIGPYKLETELGRGGMGVVYLASRDDQQYRKKVAIKLLQPGMEGDEVLQRFLNERQILANLDHPNICRLLDGGVTPEGELYIIMEYVRRGLPIDEYCNRNGVSIRDRLVLFRQACDAVQYAHRFLIIHRDLKPSNILVSDDGRVKLMDFGIAKNLLSGFNNDPSPKTIGLQLMTPAYASPEQVRAKAISTSSDVYSLGVVLYELITGRHPFRMKDQALTGLLENICDREPPRPSAMVMRPGDYSPAQGARELFAQTAGEAVPSRLAKRLKGDLDWIVLMSLRKDPMRRYASVEQLNEDIRRHLEDLPVIARKDTFGYRAAKFAARNRLGIAAVALILIAIAVGIVSTRREQERAHRRFNDVRELANSILFEISDQIRDLPGSTPARMLLVKRALTYLDRLSQDAGNDVSFQTELAEAYKKVSEIQFRVGNPNLGDTAGALASANKELAIREWIAKQDHGTTARMALAASHQRLSELLQGVGDVSGAADHVRKAQQIREELYAQDPVNRGARADLAAVYRVAGDLQKLVGTPQAAVELYRKSLRIREPLLAEAPGDPLVRRQLSMDLVRIADSLGSPYETNLGQYAEARETYLRALAMRLDLQMEQPDKPGPKRDVANVYQRLGSILIEMNQYRESLAMSRKAREICSSLWEADPANFELHRDVGVQDNQIGLALEKLGDLRGAEEALRKTLAINSELVAKNAISDRSHDDVASSHSTLGLFLLRHGRGAEARDHLQQAFETYRELVAKNSGSSRYVAREMKALAGLAQIHAKSGEVPAARAEYRQALAFAQQLRSQGKLGASEKDEPQRIATALAALHE